MISIVGPFGAPLALAVAAALHAGFQLTVTLLVYPGLADAAAEARSRPDRGWDDWFTFHDRHSRRIVPVVALTYVALAAASGWTLMRLVGDGSGVGAWTWLALAAAAVAVGVTAFAAVPLHDRLGGGPDAALVRRLLVVDRVRTSAAVLCLVAAVTALETEGLTVRLTG